MWGVIPAAGRGSRIQPLAFSKELLPVGSRLEGGVERPRAVSEYLVERMIAGGAQHLAFVVAPGKTDIVEYYGGRVRDADVCYVVQPDASGLCDALFRASPLVPRDDLVLVGLPDTIWFPADGYRALPDDGLGFLLFPVSNPERFDAVLVDDAGHVVDVQVKRADAGTPWIWGAIKMPGAVFHELHDLWRHRDRRDEYLGTLVNAWLARGGHAVGVRAGTSYVDVGTVHGYREAIAVLGREPEAGAA
ncbi:MAG TPA: hypothetical protein VFY16_03155 [Gemmatimonadaceae bacterium]|nr:hypothetical protein [Gemmatimonadaceae bacterium]